MVEGLLKVTDTIEVFVTYSKHDARYLKDDSLLGFLRGLEREGVSFWSDREIPQGALWDADIEQHLAAAPWPRSTCRWPGAARRSRTW